MRLLRTTFPITLSLCLLLTACTSTTQTATPGAAPDTRQSIDLLITGGSVLTMAGPNLEHASVAIANGAIVDVGLSSEIDPRYRATEIIDAKGSVVLPGFVNAHTHAPMTLFRGIADDRDLMDWLQNFIFPAEAKNVDAEFVRWGTRLALCEMIRSGTTTFADMYYYEADIAREVRKAGLRGVLGETVLDFPAPDNKTWDEAIAYMRRFAAEFKGDGLITAAIAPHAPYTVSADHLRQVRALATELGVPILIHVAETEDELRQVAERASGATPVAYLESLGFLGDDVLAAHSIWVTAPDIETLARRKVGVAHNPESNMLLASGVAPIAALRGAGIDVGIGTDGPAGSNNNLDMIEEMGSAARLQKISRRDPKALTARTVLEMATIGGARALGLGDRVGSIEKGKRADVIVLDLATSHTQPVYSTESAIVYAAKGSDVTHTIVDGRVLMRDRKLLTIDEGPVLAKADAYRTQIQESVAK